jgi:hypothetical protein
MVRASSIPLYTSIRTGLLMAGLSAALAACGGGGGGDKKAVVKLVNEPGNVELLSPPKSEDNQIWTSFMIKESTHPTAIESNGKGGACLIADLNSFGIPAMPGNPTRRCTLNADCQGGLNVPGTPTAGWWGYCDMDGDKKCWVRPGPPPVFCNINGTVRPLDKVIDTPHVSIDPFKAKFPGPVRWRAIACLNGKDNKDCTRMDGGVRREVMGSPKAVP